MIADIGIMPLTYTVHYIRTLTTDISPALEVGDFEHILAEAINLPGLSTNLLFFALIPLIIYVLIKRLRYLSRLRSEHNNIFEAQLKMPPSEPVCNDIVLSRDKEHRHIKKEKLFKITMPIIKQQEAI